MSRTSDDTLGRRRFQLLRQQAVEDAIAKIRHAPAAEWSTFSSEDYTRLREILADLWVHLGKEKWGRYTFSTLTRQDIRRILDLGPCAEKSTPPCSTLDEMDLILSGSGRNEHTP